MNDSAKATPLVASDEADRKGLQLGKAQGEALSKTLKHMIEDVAGDGGYVRHGDYIVSYAIEKAEGMWMPRAGKLTWEDPEKENCHVEIAVQDAADGRLIPGLKVEVTLADSDGNEVGTHTQPLLWHPYLYHYGRNWQVPKDGTYSMRVRFEAPNFMRHDKKNGRRFTEDCDIMFEKVKIETGKG